MRLIDNFLNRIQQTPLLDLVKQYNLKVNYSEDGTTFSLNYDQINTPRNDFTDCCRGIILTGSISDSSNLKIVSLPLYRFSNANPQTIKSIDWDSAIYQTKVDGSLIQYYYHPIWERWVATTKGMPKCKDSIKSINKFTKEEITYNGNFEDLFNETANKLGLNLNNCIEGHTYIFELVTPYNQVINKYTEDSITLLSVRNLSSYEEISYEDLKSISKDLNVNLVTNHSFKSFTECKEKINTSKLGDSTFEGYVIVDKNFNRLKIKSSKYALIALFNSKSEKIDSKYRLIEIVILNEVEEISSIFPSLKKELELLQKSYDSKIKSLKPSFNSLKENLLTMWKVYCEEEKDNQITFNNFVKDNSKEVYSLVNKTVNTVAKINKTSEKGSEKTFSSIIFKSLTQDINLTFEESLNIIFKDKTKKKNLYKLLNSSK